MLRTARSRLPGVRMTSRAGEKQDLGRLGEGTLGSLIERTDRFQFVAEELQPERMRGHRGEQVDHVPPDAELPLPFHQRDPAVAPCSQLSDQLVPLPGVAHADPFHVVLKRLPRDQLLHQGRNGNHNDGRLPVGEPVEGLHPGEFRLPLKGEHVRRQEIPGGQKKGLPRAQKEGEVPDAGRGLLFGRADDDERPAETPENEGR